MGVTDIQRIYDKLEEISGKVTDLANTATRCDKAVHGNGTPGLLTRTTIIEQAIIAITKSHDECPAREAMSGNARRQAASNILALGSLAVALIAVLVAVTQ